MHASAREKALVGFAHVLTEVPWTVDAEDIARLRKADISEQAIEQAILVTAFFNYFPRVADGTGIEWDYESPLPRIVVDSTREALPRFPETDWNRNIDGSGLPHFDHVPNVANLLGPWRVLHMERPEPFGPGTRRLIARICAEELCDSAAVSAWNDAHPTSEMEHRLAAFARKLTRTPWAMNAHDVEMLRTTGLSDVAILGAITLVAHQNAISRMHHALAAMRTPSP